MARLTEEMVIARTRQSDLASVKKLNCWGAELVDVSLLRRMPNVEVLALSVNKITTLADFAHCPRLRELYIRKNRVDDLSEIRHLQRLPRLTQLWLEENACTDRADYRMTVLRNLPTLQKLDNITVEPEELEEAMRKGTPIADPDDEDYQQEEYSQYGRSRECSPERLAERGEPEYRREQGSDCSEGAADTTYSEPVSNGQQRQRSSPAAQISPTRQRAYTPEPEERYEYAQPVNRQQQYYERAPPADTTARLRHASSTDSASTDKAFGIRHSQSAHSVKQDYASNGDSTRHHTSPQYRHSADVHQYADTHQERCESYQQVPHSRCAAECDRDSSRESLGRREREGDIASAVMADHRGFTRRPVTRNSNLLSAVLCLVKELDYPSLEVAEMAVRCRMDELANQQS